MPRELDLPLPHPVRAPECLAPSNGRDQRGARRRSRTFGAAQRALRVLAAAALFVVGAVHLQQDLGAGYLSVPVIGVLFILNFAGATVVALGLLAPLRRVVGRWCDLALDALAVLGIGVAGGALAALLFAEHHSLFGFREAGYRPVIQVAIGSEAAAVLLLACLLAIRRTRAR